MAGNAREHHSKYYPSEESWTGSPVWWFDIPTSFLQETPAGSVGLRCKSPDGESEKTLCVPCTYLLENVGGLDVVPSQGRDVVRLHLSARPEDEFTDLRGEGQVRFSSCLQA